MQDTRGFTLIEVLLALSITAVVMTTVTTSFVVTLEAREQVDSLSESTEAGPRILSLLERDLRNLWVFNVKDNAVLRGRNLDIGSFEADRIDFLCSTDAVGHVIDMQNRQVRPSVCEVGYWLKQNPRYRDLMELWRREDPMIDDNLIEGGSFQLIHDRIKVFKIRYYNSLGYESEELHEWNSAEKDLLPRRIKIEFTLERKRASRNQVNDVEIEDLEGAEKTYVRHIVFDSRYQTILRSGIARIPVAPPPPGESDPGQNPAGPGNSATERGGAGGFPGMNDMKVDNGAVTTQFGSRRGDGRGGPPSLPPGTRMGPGNGQQGQPPFNLGDLFRGAGNRPSGGNPFSGGR